MPEENQRLRLYKKIAGANSEASVNEMRAEMEDRYGAPPDATVYLLEAAFLRLECERLGIAQIDRKRAELHIRFMENAAVDPRTSCNWWRATPSAARSSRRRDCSSSRYAPRDPTNCRQEHKPAFRFINAYDPDGKYLRMV